MKRNFLLLLLTFTYFGNANGGVDTVHVSDHKFVPANLNALVGDTILWVWDNGTHTTTGTAVNIPPGTDTWDAPIDAANPSFEYVIKVPGTYFYFSKLDGDMSASFTATGTLPVQLINFTVTNAPNNRALVHWSTVNEQNTSYFSVQRSSDAKKFIETGRVNAAGNSSVLRSYSFTDNNIQESEKLYYKIVTVDKDGKKTAGSTATFKNTPAITKFITLNPNPVGNPCNLNVRFTADEQGKMFINVYDVSGSLVKHTQINALAGLNKLHLLLGNLSPGTYKILFTLHDKIDLKTIAVQ